MTISLPPSRRRIEGVGPTNPNLAIVGEQPGKTELVHGTPFVGPAGRELDQCLANALIPRHECYITNTIKDLDRPLKFYIDLPSQARGIPKVSSEGRQYINYLKEELEYVRPNLVVAAGNVALYALCDRWGVTKWRGSILESTLIPKLKVLPIYHPSTILPKAGNWGGNFLNKHQITFDLKRARANSLTPLATETYREILIRPSFLDAMQFLLQCQHQPIIDCDIEVVNEQLFCIAFAYPEEKHDVAMCIPFVAGHDYFPIDQEATIMREIAKIFENPSIAMGGQNFGFDAGFMLNRYGIHTNGEIHDTMIAQKISLPDYPAGLDYITSVHTDMPYYKGEGKKYMKVGGDLESFWVYNARDALATLASRKSQFRDLEAQSNIPTYDRQRQLIPSLVYMQQRGIRVDVQGMLDQRTVVEEKVKILEAELTELVGRPINYNSPKQMKAYFYEELGIKPYTKRGSKGTTITVDVNALKRLARGTTVRAGLRQAKIIMELRSLSTKTLGTYLSLDKIDPDGRYRSSYNPVGARTGRLSSSENIFGTGGNQQNWPHDLLKFMLADDGYMAYSIDLSQIENRIVANIGRVHEMIEAFETGQDVHSLTASLLFDKPIEDITTEDGTCPVGDGSHSERFWGKKANHSLNYDIRYKQFALINEITEAEAKQMINKYHKAYPGVRNGFHQMVQSQLKESRTLTNLFGRVRVFHNQWGDDLFREAYAHIPQSTTADKINEQGLNFIYYNQPRFGPIEILRQVHDDIGFQIPLPPRVTWHVHARMLWEIKASLETPLVWHDREFMVPADLTVGTSFGKKESVEIKSKKFPLTIDELAKKLEEVHEQLTRTP